MAGVEPPAESRDFALLIGVKSYTKLDPLKSAINDIEFVKKWLRDKRGGNIPDEHVVTVPDPQSSDEIAEKAAEIADRAHRMGGGRRMYLFWSGHGHTGGADDVHLCMRSWERTNPAHVVTARIYMMAFIESDLFEEVLGFFDCCRNELTTKSVDASRPPFDRKSKSPATRFRGSLAFFGTKDKAKAWNFEEVDGPQQFGYFTKAVVDGLMGDAVDDAAQPGVMIRQLQEYAIQRTREFSTHQQHPDPHAHNLEHCRLGNATPVRRLLLTPQRTCREGARLIGARGRVLWRAATDVDAGETIDVEVERYNYILEDHEGKPLWGGVITPGFEPLRVKF